MGIVGNSLRFVLNFLVGDQDDVGVTIRKHVLAVATLTTVVRRDEDLRVLEVRLERWPLQEFLPSWPFEVAGDHDAKTIVKKKRNQAEIIRISECRIACAVAPK